MRKVNVNNCKKYSSVQSRQRVERSRSKLGRSESEYVEDCDAANAHHSIVVVWLGLLLKVELSVTLLKI